MGFSGNLTIKQVGIRDWDHWIIQEPIQYVSEAGQTYVVPKGFVTDGATVPRVLWALIPPLGRCLSAAILHDYLQFQLYANRPLDGARTTREVDALFYEASRACNVRPLPAWVMWLGVRIKTLLSPRP